jgi:hypothetical protein
LAAYHTRLTSPSIYRGDEAVAASGHRLDTAALFSVLVENAAQRGNLDGQIAFIDHHSWPDYLHNHVFRHELPVPFDQQT